MKSFIKIFMVRETYGQLSAIVNGRQEISRGHKEYGIDWKFDKIDEKYFKELLNNRDDLMFAVETKSGKILEVDKNDIGKFVNL